MLLYYHVPWNWCNYVLLVALGGIFGINLSVCAMEAGADWQSELVICKFWIWYDGQWQTTEMWVTRELCDLFHAVNSLLNASLTAAAWSQLMPNGCAQLIIIMTESEKPLAIDIQFKSLLSKALRSSNQKYESIYKRKFSIMFFLNNYSYFQDKKHIKNIFAKKMIVRCFNA